MDKEVYFIKAQCHQTHREQGYQFGGDDIKEQYDYVVDQKRFTGTKINLETNSFDICPGYNDLYKHVVNLDHTKYNLVIVGGDHTVAIPTILALNEKYDNNLKVVVIDPYADIHPFNVSETSNLNEVVFSSLMGKTGIPFIENEQQVDMSPDQFVFVGINGEESDMLDEECLEYYKLDKIRDIGITQLTDILKCDKPIYITMDVRALNKNGFQYEEIMTILKSLKQNIVGIDICEHNPSIGTVEDNRMIRETVRKILVELFDIKEKKINIFNENSEFLIYRPMRQKNPHEDIGWYILRGLDNDTKNRIIESISDDAIVNLEIEEEDYLVTKTTMQEQNKKSYYTSTTINDTTLFPQEKASMCFELLN